MSCHHLVAAHATARPDAVAVVDGQARVGYRELDERANRLAHHLVAGGVGPGVLVGVRLPRSAETVVALLAVLKAGGAYLPLDPAYPAHRIEHMVADARPAVVLTEEALSRDAAVIAARPAHDPAVEVAPDDLAYVIYTSGSTGTPKGVLVPHAGLANLVGWHIARYGLGPGEHTAHVAALGFDASVWEVWPTLAAGATLHLPAEADRTDPDRLFSWLAGSGVTVTFLPTPMAEAVLRLPPRPSSLRTVLTGGDALTAAPPPGTPFELVNHYGPTEASVVATAITVRAGEPGPPPIGLPIDNVRTQVVDGELYVGGAGIARGYLNRPALTAERFVPGPSGGRLYRTGDLVSRRADGVLEFRGRVDDQVQVRGFRVEPAEIAAALATHPGVAQAAVVSRSGRLVGYVVGPVTDTELLAHAADRLPDHMVPSAVVVLDALPLTPNGKVDRDALPDPTDVAEAVAPRDEVEAMIAEVWYDVLDLPDRPPHVHDNFYVLGGHSLLATQLTVRLRDLLGVDLPTGVTLSNPTIDALAREIRTREPVPGHLDEVAARYRMVATMSDEEVARMLEELGQTG